MRKITSILFILLGFLPVMLVLCFDIKQDLFDEEQTELVHQNEEDNNEGVNLLEDLPDWIQSPYQTENEEIIFLITDLNTFGCQTWMTSENYLKAFRKMLL